MKKVRSSQPAIQFFPVSIVKSIDNSGVDFNNKVGKISERLLYCQKISREENFANQALRDIFLILGEFNFANQGKLCISREFNFANGQNRYLSFFLFLKKTIKTQHFISFINQILCSSHS